MLRLENFEAESLSTGFISSSIIPKLSGINEKRASIRKFIIVGYRFVIGIMINDMVTSKAETAINLKPNSRPLEAINVIFPPNLSPSISGISTLLIKNSCINASGIVKIKKGRSNFPIIVK
jgi:hypothetical protein